jgi:hypothetical protein
MVSIFRREYLWVGFFLFLMKPPVFILGSAKFIPLDEKAIMFITH